MLVCEPYDDWPISRNTHPFLLSLVTEPFIEVILCSKKRKRGYLKGNGLSVTVRGTRLRFSRKYPIFT